MTAGSPPTFDKFGWIKAIQADATLSDKTFRLAVLIGVTYTRKDGTGWAVELAELSVKLAGGLSQKRMNAALDQLVERGYLVDAGRSGGGRGNTARRSFNLRKPGTPASRVCAETRDARVLNPGRWRTKPGTLAPEFVPSDLCEPPPTGTSTGISTGARERQSVSAQKLAAGDPDCPYCLGAGEFTFDDSARTCDHTPAMARFKARVDAIAAAG